jgi:hypothetical protein
VRVRVQNPVGEGAMRVRTRPGAICGAACGALTASRGRARVGFDVGDIVEADRDADHPV